MITEFFASILTFIFIFLSINVIRNRRALKIPLLDNGNEKLQRCIRAHANFIEYTPIFIILLFFSERNGDPWYITTLCGILFTIGRLLHIYGILKAETCENSKRNVFMFRVIGMGLTFSILILMAVIVLMQSIFLSIK